VAPAVAGTRVLPSMVADQLGRACGVPAVAVGFRAMTEADLSALAQWQSEPHVARWWDAESRDEQSARRKYLPRIHGDDPTRMWVLEVDGRPVGFLQDYRVGDDPDYAAQTGYPDAVGFDYAIGEAGLVDRGLGTRATWEFCRDVLRRDYPAVEHFLASPSHRNVASLRVLAKCGFVAGDRIEGESAGRPDAEIVCTLDVRHWLG
jgi:aminoglycoside 6'-N-acetyltransferase